MSHPESEAGHVEHPAEGIPDVVDRIESLRDTIAAFGAASGPVAIDTERAQGFRYSAKAYLIQLRRAGAGTALIDPVAFEDRDGHTDLSPLREAMGDAEWILHAATQDLPCLVDVGLVPTRIFDTELAGRLLNLPRVGLGALLDEALGVKLRKEHSAADWSRRPLPDEWLSYAALDVEFLVDLRDWLEAELDTAGKLEWAHQEFTHLASQATLTPPPRRDPWRRTSGMHSLKTGLQLAVVREIWSERDAIAARMDRAPGRILPDRAIVAVANLVTPATIRALGREQLRDIPEFSWRFAARFESNWLACLSRVAQLPRDQWPARHVAQEVPQTPKSWERRNPEAYARWHQLRPLVVARAEEVDVPPENLLTPESLRQLAWHGCEPTAQAVDEFLAHLHARPWQRAAVAEVLAAGLMETPETQDNAAMQDAATPSGVNP